MSFWQVRSVEPSGGSPPVSWVVPGGMTARMTASPRFAFTARDENQGRLRTSGLSIDRLTKRGAMDSFWLAGVTGTMTLAGVGMGSFLTYVFNERHQRRTETLAIFHRAMAAVATAQAARHYPQRLSANLISGPDSDGADRELEELTLQLQKQGIQRYDEKNALAREALAEVQPFCPEIAPYLDAWAISEDEVPKVQQLLRSALQRTLRGKASSAGSRLH